MDDVGVFIHHVIFDMYILADHCGGQDNTVFHHSALFDGASPADDRVLNGSLNQAAVGYDGVFHIRIVKILCRAGVVGSGINGPFVIKEILRGFEIDKTK